MGDPKQQSMTWILFALTTVGCWGVYGVFLHKGQVLMSDPANGRYKAFLFVGIAYFLTAVLAPLAVLMMNKATWSFPAGGLWWSLIAGIVGAIGAFCVLLAFGAAPKPTYVYVPVVMSIIFAGAPIVNAAVSITMEKNWAHVPWQFLLGIVLAAGGGYLVVTYKPTAQHGPPTPPGAPSAHVAPSAPAGGGGQPTRSHGT